MCCGSHGQLTEHRAVRPGGPCRRVALSRVLNGRASVSAALALALERIGWSDAEHWDADASDLLSIERKEERVFDWNVLKNPRAIPLVVIALLAGIIIIVNIIATNPTPLTEIDVQRALKKYLNEDILDDDIFPEDAKMPTDPRAFEFGSFNEFRELIERGTGTSYPEISGMDYVSHVAMNFVLGTPFEGRININSEPAMDHINIYFLRNDNERLAHRFNQNCTFIGYFRTVVCDIELFSRLFADIDRTRETYNLVFMGMGDAFDPQELEELIRRALANDGRIEIWEDEKLKERVGGLLKANILMWILGHEIGHAVLHYEAVVKEGMHLHFDLRYDLRESEADRFVAEQIVRVPGRAAQFYSLLIEFIHQEFRREYLKDRSLRLIVQMLLHNKAAQETRDALKQWDLPLHNKVRVAPSEGRFPLLIRALRIADSLLEVAPSIDASGHHRVIASNVSVVRAGPIEFIQSKLSAFVQSRLMERFE